MKAEMLFEVIVIHSFAAFQTRDLSLGFIIVENWANFYRSDPAVTVTSERRLLTSNLSSSSSLEHSRECVHGREDLCVWVRAHERVGKRERESSLLRRQWERIKTRATFRDSNRWQRIRGNIIPVNENQRILSFQRIATLQGNFRC